MDASKLKNKRWTALVPQRQLLGRSGRPIQSSLHRPSRLIGILPEEAYIQILIHLGLSDIANLACACRKLAALSTDERVWNAKLSILNWTGDCPVDAQRILDKREGKKRQSIDGLSNAISINRSNGPSLKLQASPPKAGPNKRTSITSSSSAIQSSNNISTSTALSPSPSNNTILDNDDDDGFGDFIDFSSEARHNANTTNGTPSDAFISPNPDLNGTFSEINLNSEPLQPSKASSNPQSISNGKRQDEDLLMMFDDGVEDIGMGHVTPATHPVAPMQAPDVSSNGRSKPSAPVKGVTSLASSTSYHSPALSRDLFIAYYRYLIPYYVSLQYQSTSSLVFTQAQLTDLKKAYILTNLKRLIMNKEISPTQYKARLTTVIKNLNSSTDYFKSYLLSKFENANNNRIIYEMRNFTLPFYALLDNSDNNKIGNSLGGNEILQIFVDKIEIFNDNSWDPLSNLTKTFDTTDQLVDGIDFSAMDSFMNHVIGIVQKEGTTIARVFPKDSDALVYFTDRIANDVISDYIVDLLGAAHNLTNPLFLLTTAATFGQCQRLIDTVLSIEPKSSKVNYNSVSKVVYEMFRPHTKGYLKEEPEWCRIYLQEICIEWERKLLEERKNRDPSLSLLNNSNPQMAKRNILAGFTKALLLPVTIVPKTVALSVNAITQGSTMAFNAMTGTFSSSSTGASTPKTIVSNATPGLKNGTMTPTTPMSSVEPKEFPGLHSENFQSLISIETAMQLIQADRECLKRVQTFTGYTGDIGLRVKRVIEEIFVILCQTVSANHLTPAFAKATEQMGQYKPADHPVDESVAPLVQFFELVHIGDTILQMVQVYFDKEMKSYVDKNDFLSTIVREKKKFENNLDESVASGLNAGVNILMSQAEYILHSKQEPYDFCPELSKDGNNSQNNSKALVIDIEGPTKAAEAVVDCLRSHCQMLKGSTDKAILEVFHQEVGLRLHGMLLKHLKKSIVSISGGFQVIADLNLYTSFINSLKLPNVNPYFTALKMAANVFIIDSPRDLGMMARDLERYEGTLRIEDIMEMVQCRIDWKKIEREVEKEVFGFKTEDCIIV